MRYFAPSEEIPMAGHPTIATTWALVESGRGIQGITQAGQTFARPFVNPPALGEDSFTGSATGAMGAYIWYHGLFGQPTFRAEQGHDMGRPGIATVEVVGPRNAIETVKVGGAAVTVLTGTMSF